MEKEMDAMIMDGKELHTGAIAAARNIKNPISLARKVMEQTPHCLLVGEGAQVFALEQGVEIVDQRALVTEEALAEYERFRSHYAHTVGTLFNTNSVSSTAIDSTSSINFSLPTSAFPFHGGHDTVGAVAMDAYGNIACGTSTGGITGKRVGRVGDSPLVGLGGYADASVGGCSVTGHGESIMRVVLASRVIGNMDIPGNTETNMKRHVRGGVVGEQQVGMNPSEAARAALTYMWKRVHGRGGAIAIDSDGRIGHWATTEAMAWASAEGVKGLSPAKEDSGVDNTEAFAELQ